MADKWDFEVFWNEALKQLRDTLTEQEYETWLKNVSYVSSAEGAIIVQVPSSFYRDQVTQRFQRAIETALLDLSGQKLKVSFTLRAGDWRI